MSSRKFSGLNTSYEKDLVICIFNHSHRVKIPVVTQNSLTNHAKCLQNRYRPQGSPHVVPIFSCMYNLGQVTNSSLEN